MQYLAGAGSWLARKMASTQEASNQEEGLLEWTRRLHDVDDGLSVEEWQQHLMRSGDVTRCYARGKYYPAKDVDDGTIMRMLSLCNSTGISPVEWNCSLMPNSSLNEPAYDMHMTQIRVMETPDVYKTFLDFIGGYDEAKHVFGVLLVQPIGHPVAAQLWIRVKSRVFVGQMDPDSATEELAASLATPRADTDEPLKGLWIGHYYHPITEVAREAIKHMGASPFWQERKKQREELTELARVGKWDDVFASRLLAEELTAHCIMHGTMHSLTEYNSFTAEAMWLYFRMNNSAAKQELPGYESCTMDLGAIGRTPEFVANEIAANPTLYKALLPLFQHIASPSVGKNAFMFIVQPVDMDSPTLIWLRIGPHIKVRRITNNRSYDTILKALHSNNTPYLQPGIFIGSVHYAFFVDEHFAQR